VLVMSAPLDWFASENGDRYDIWLPQGTYHIEAEDNDYRYYKAPGQVTLGKKKIFSAQNNMPQGGGIFFSKNAGCKYPSGAYVDFKDGEKLLVFYFDFRFTGQEGKRWHYVDE
jgi:major membrane immunogen (membrane-anchored lipoprotein)